MKFTPGKIRDHGDARRSRVSAHRFATLTAGLWCASLLLAAPGFGAQTAEPKGLPLARGLLHKNIACRSAREFHCHIFVPKAYQADTATPVLYVFAPGGDAPVELYRLAADRLGWLVCGSVESRNGQELDYHEKVLAAMQAEMQARFTLHPHRVYFSGMSGAARVALACFYAHADSAAGVLAMAAGWSWSAAQMPTVAGGACVGLAGRHDFNYCELVALADKTAAANMASLFMDFEGQHGWAPKELIAQAMDWLEIQYFIRSPHLTAAEKTRRPGFIADQIRKISLAGATMASYETCEGLHRDLSADPEFLNSVDRMMADIKPKLMVELAAREALREAFATAHSKHTAYQMDQMLQTQSRELALKYPITLYGARAGIMAGVLGKRLKLYPPELKK